MVEITIALILAAAVYVCLPRIPTSFTVTITHVHQAPPTQPAVALPPDPAEKAKHESLLSEMNSILNIFNGGQDGQENS